MHPQASCDIKTQKESQHKTFSRNTDTFILLNVPGGKPNRKRAEPKRVSQPAQKGQTCFYYAAKISAMLEEDYIDQQKKIDRKFASEYRKAYSNLSTYDSLRKMLMEMIHSLPEKLSKPRLISFFKFASIDNSSSSPFASYEKILPEILNSFQKSSEENIEQFLENFIIQKRLLSSLDFIEKIGLNPEKELKDFIEKTREKLSSIGNQQNLSELQSPNALTLKQKELLFFKISLSKIERIFDLVPTSWKPFQDIQVLFDLIQNGQSPIIFCGYFGIQFYNQSCMHLNKENIEGYTIFGWPKNSHKNEPNYVAGHSIAVIGVRKNTSSVEPKGWVYYIDPIDSSTPNEKRKIYKISYEQFCNNCLDGIVNASYHKSAIGLEALDYGRQRKRPFKLNS